MLRPPAAWTTFVCNLHFGQNRRILTPFFDLMTPLPGINTRFFPRLSDYG